MTDTGHARNAVSSYHGYLDRRRFHIVVDALPTDAAR